MIKVSSGGEMLDLLPANFKEDPDWIAFSYALKMAAAKLTRYQEKAKMYGSLNGQGDDILDYMAVEKRTMFYDEEAAPNKKRSIIRDSGRIYQKAGTPSAVQEVVTAAFGESEIIEWFDFPEGDGNPGEFDIEVTADISLTPEAFEQFVKTVENAKALTAHLRQVIVKRPVMITRYTGAAAVHNIRSVVVSLYNLEA